MINSKPYLNGTIYKESELIYHLSDILGKKVRILRREAEDDFSVGMLGDIKEINTIFIDRQLGDHWNCNLVKIVIDISKYKEENKMLNSIQEGLQLFNLDVENEIEIQIALQVASFKVIQDYEDTDLLLVFD